MPTQPATRRCCKPANAASRRGVIAALSVLQEETMPMTSDEMLAERERFRREQESPVRRQADLPLQVPE